jgi:hypothetical protein
MDQSKKTMRHFYCRDVLWETFEQMANDFDCSIDYLINEAMRYYARSKNYQSASGGAGVSANLGPPGAGSGPGSMSGGAGRKPAPPTNPPSQANPPSQRRPAPATPGYAGPPAGAPRQAPPTPAYAGGGGANFAQASSTGGGYAAAGAQPYASQHSSAQANAAPPLPNANAAPSAAAVPAGSTLFLVYNGQRYPVNKDQFIIGRGSKTSDLAIKDGNISRKHAAVIRRNGTFYIKDLGSTNGIDYKGMRIDNKRIDEGDVFHLCDYELRFTYRPE